MADENGASESGEQASEEAQQDQTQDAQQSTQDDQQETPEQTIARLTREVESARKEAGKQRVNAKQAAADEARNATLSKVLEALGVKADGSKKVSLEDVQAESAKKDASLAQLAAENVVLRRAATLGADADKLLNWSPFTSAVGKLDPGADDYQTQVDQLITEQKTSNPFLATQAVGKSGSEIGGSGPQAITKERFDAMSGEELNTLYRNDPATFKRLADL
jgi:hypothetical protein